MQSIPSLLTFTIQGETMNGFVNTVNGATIQIGTAIPPQIINWRGYRVVLDSDTTLSTIGIIYVDIPWLGSSNMQDGRSFANQLPLFLDSKITLKTEMNMPLQLVSQIEKVFKVAVFDRQGNKIDPAKVLSVSLYFTYGSSST